MIEKLQKSISDSATARWTVLIAVSLTMFCGYFMCDVMSPLKTLLGEICGWSDVDYGIFMSSYGWLNVMLLMLIMGGIILDKMGARFTGVFATGVMLIGASLKYYALGYMDSTEMTVIPYIGTIKSQVLTAAIGYAIFAFGYETMGITASKIVVRWFRGKELAFALGMNIAFARLGTMLAFSLPIPIYEYFQSISMPILFCTVLLLIGFMTFMVFVVMDRKLDRERAQEGLAADEKFSFRDIYLIFQNRGFWYLSALCLLFYAAVFPFLKFATEFMAIKYAIEPKFAGYIVSLLPLGTLLLTPLFGGIYDKKGKGATIMIIGSLLLIFVYMVFSIGALNHWAVGVAMMIVLGVAFSLVPSAMWPSLAKIIPEQRLGTAYALTFWFQNIGLAGVPLLISGVLETYGNGNSNDAVTLDYTIPTYIFLVLGITALIFSLLLKREDRIKGYGLEKPNIKGC